MVLVRRNRGSGNQNTTFNILNNVYSSRMTKTSELLERLGFRRVLAATLAFMVDNQGKTVTLRDVELAYGLRQPEVSIGMGWLQEKGWVTVTTQPLGEGERGRKVNLYRLIPAIQIYTAIEREQMRSLKDVQGNLAKLKRNMRIEEKAEMMVAESGQPDSIPEASAPVTSGDKLAIAKDETPSAREQQQQL